MKLYIDYCGALHATLGIPRIQGDEHLNHWGALADLCGGFDSLLEIQATKGFIGFIDPLPWADELMRIAEASGHEPVFLTAVVSHERETWIKLNFPNVDYICTPFKHPLAHRAMLIDDSEKNCESWEAAGGYPILFPQPWNSAYRSGVDRLQVVRNGVSKFGGVRK
jgi:hypothetical protein